MGMHNAQQDEEYEGEEVDKLLEGFGIYTKTLRCLFVGLLLDDAVGVCD